ncbi:hypothetical protein BC830DRAFT_488376 [Chytriomyces sp. MP71]|nr:hypothetical protein BC830DRAFT_488376 [Chytriomyces sp. MP71]
MAVSSRSDWVFGRTAKDIDNVPNACTHSQLPDYGHHFTPSEICQWTRRSLWTSLSPRGRHFICAHVPHRTHRLMDIRCWRSGCPSMSVENADQSDHIRSPSSLRMGVCIQARFKERKHRINQITNELHVYLNARRCFMHILIHIETSEILIIHFTAALGKWSPNK